MQCDICSRTGGSKLAFLCPTDARNQLYDRRIRHARVLIETEALGQQVHQALEPTIDSSDVTSSRTSAWRLEQAQADKQRVEERTRHILAQAEELRVRIQAAERFGAAQLASIARRKSEYASAVNGLDTRRVKQTEEVEKKTKVTKFKWNQLHYTATHSRSFLCGEAAKLYGLRRRRDEDLWLEDFGIGGVGIMDLRTMNSASPAQVTTALSHIAHLLSLSTHYLGVQMPAEITLPHRDYPLPTIFSLAASHMNYQADFPGSSSTSGASSPVATTGDALNLPRPRPLFIHKPLPMLVKEDPAAYALFIEGATLLAYNVAWVCKSQGIPVGDSSSFDDICDIGSNLFNLLIGNQPRPGLPVRTPSTSRDADTPVDEGRKTVAAIGHFSHGTAHTFLAGAEGTDFIRSWKLASPLKLADKLKSHLLAELHNAEWEVLEHNAWAEDDGEDDGVVIAHSSRRGSVEKQAQSRAAAQSFMSMRSVADHVNYGTAERKPGTSGWTKLKPR